MQIYRSRSSQVWGWLCVGLGALILLIQLIGSGLEQIHVALGIAVAFAAAGYAAFLRPSVAVGEDHVELRNVTQTVVAPFSRLAGLEAHWSLELVGDDDKKAGAFAAPSRTGRDRVRPAEDGKSAEVAGLITAAWDAYRASADTAVEPTAASALGHPPAPAFSRRVDWVGVGAVAAAVAGLALAFLA
ncbi:PH domain-containing protein [Demequina sp. NBRC 110055]|uniref:PH domain-containing protein n=1 Tax=Demequina sp. NBRC 110055 TaxID=1570344 RepID=UPI001356424F|nr:PH domain-containing protein [Demequina sp. NBRC 110055]